MKYKIFAAAAATIFTAMTADVNAAICSCDKWFDGKTTCGKDYSVINPQYWACRSLFGTVNTLCKGVCLGGTFEAQPAKLKQNEDSCQKGEKNKNNCQDMLDKDVTKSSDDTTKVTEAAILKAQEDLDKEAAQEAACYANTGQPCVTP